jgi:hypothetical protein
MPRYPLAARVVHWPPDAREEFEERAALVADGCKVSREESERRAEAIVRANWIRERIAP